jgi:CRISPR/Cas system-associated exonuclease Cas4 (RecB family)
MECLNLDSGFVIYENKNNQEILPIYIERDQPFIDKLFKKYRKFHGAYLSKEIPVQPYKRSSANCSSCDLAKHCWAEGEQNESEDTPF